MLKAEQANTTTEIHEVKDVSGFLSIKLDKNCRAYRLFKESCNEQSTLETYEEEQKRIILTESKNFSMLTENYTTKEHYIH